MSDTFRTVSFLKQRLGPLAWGALLVFMVSRCGDVAAMLARLFLGHKLSSLDFGAVDPVLAVVAVLGIPISVIFQIAVKSISRLQAMGRTGECSGLLRDLAKLAAVGSILAVGVVLGLQDYILSRLHLTSVTFVFIVAAMFVVSWWTPMYMAVLQGGRNYRVLLVAVLTSAFLLLFLTVALVTAGLGLQGALVARVGASVVTAIVVLFMLRDAFRGARESYTGEWAVMKAMILPMSVYTASTTLLYYFDRLFVRNYLLQDSGGYGAVVVLGSMPLYLIGSIVFVIFPLASAEHAVGRDIARFHRSALLVGLAITVCCAAGFLLVAGPLIFLIRYWNEAFVPYARYLWVYAVVMGLQGTIQTMASVELARHRYGFLWFVAVPAFGMCSTLYLFRSMATIEFVLSVMAATHVLVLLGVWLFGFVDARGSRAPVS